MLRIRGEAGGYLAGAVFPVCSVFWATNLFPACGGRVPLVCREQKNGFALSSTVSSTVSSNRARRL